MVCIFSAIAVVCMYVMYLHSAIISLYSSYQWWQSPTFLHWIQIAYLSVRDLHAILSHWCQHHCFISISVYWSPGSAWNFHTCVVVHSFLVHHYASMEGLLLAFLLPVRRLDHYSVWPYCSNVTLVTRYHQLVWGGKMKAKNMKVIVIMTGGTL